MIASFPSTPLSCPFPQKAQDAANKSPSTLPSAENPEGDENLGSDLDSCTNFVTVSLQKRTYENLEKCYQILNGSHFNPDPVDVHLMFDYLNLVAVMAAYWDLGSCPDRVLGTYLIGLRAALNFKMDDAAASFAAKIALFLLRFEMYDVAGSFLRHIESTLSMEKLGACQYYQLARAWYAFHTNDHDTSETMVRDMLANPRILERSILVELMILRSTQLLMPGSSSPYQSGAEYWETPQALLQFGMRLAESVTNQMGKNGAAGSYKEISYVEFVVLVLRVFSTFCAVCDSCEWVRESGFLYKESFQIAERYGVPHWMASIMLRRVGRDILINAKNEAETRLREAKFILNSPGDSFLAHLKLTGVLGRKSVMSDVSSLSGSTDDDDDSFALPKVPQLAHHHHPYYPRGMHHSDDDASPTRLAQKTASPIFKRTASTAPSFVTHAAACLCSSCDDIPYQKCLIDMMYQHGALLFRQDTPLQTVIAADAGLKIYAKLTETWKRKRAAWTAAIPGVEDWNHDALDAEPCLERFWNLRIMKAEALLSLGRVGPCQAALKPLIEEAGATNGEKFASSKWSRLPLTTLGQAHYVYVVSLGSSLSASEKMMSADWVVMRTPAKSEPVSHLELTGDFDSMLNIGITERKPSVRHGSDMENIPPKRGRGLKSESVTPNALLPSVPSLSATPSALKEAQNKKPAFSIYSDVKGEGGDVSGGGDLEHKPIIKSENKSSSKITPSVSQAPKKRTTAKARTARVNLQEPDFPADSTPAAGSGFAVNSTPRSVKKPPILSADSFAKAAVASRTPKPASASLFRPGGTPSVAPSSNAGSKSKTTIAKTSTAGRVRSAKKKPVPAIAFEIPSSPDSSSEEVGDKSDDVVILASSQKLQARPKVSSRRLGPAPALDSFGSSPEVSPGSSSSSSTARKKRQQATKNAEDGIVGKSAKKVSPRRKLADNNVDSEATSSKRKCGGRRKAAPNDAVENVKASSSLDAVTKDIGELNLSTAKSRHGTYTSKVESSTSKVESSTSSTLAAPAAKTRLGTYTVPRSSSATPSTRASSRKKRAAADEVKAEGEVVRGKVEDVDDLNKSSMTVEPGTPFAPGVSSSSSANDDGSESDRFSGEDNVFTPGLLHQVDAEVIRKDSPNGLQRPKIKHMSGDLFDAAAGDADDGLLVIEEFTSHRATTLIEKALDLMTPFPMGYVARQCLERLVLLKGKMVFHCQVSFFFFFFFFGGGRALESIFISFFISLHCINTCLFAGNADSIACGGLALQSTGLGFRHNCMLNACKFIIRQKFGYAESTPQFCHTTSRGLSFDMTPQDVISRISGMIAVFCCCCHYLISISEEKLSLL